MTSHDQTVKETAGGRRQQRRSREARSLIGAPAKRWGLIAAVALISAWLIAPAAVPIYDGLGNPDEPYRWVNPPAGTKHTSPPTTATATLPAKGGRNLDAGYANSGENGPQISVYFPVLALAAPTTAASIQVTATPLAPTPPEPTDGTIITNVYRITATTSTGPASFPGSYGHDQPALQMRAPTARQPGPVFEHRLGNRWTRVDTIRVANDVYQANLTGLGEWALVQLRHPLTTGGSAGINTPLLAAGTAVLVTVIGVIAIRVGRSRKNPNRAHN
jgi:hypothetical protein